VEGGNAANNAVDGNMSTRWGSNWSVDVNPASAWWAVDLGQDYYISSTDIRWEAAYAKEYSIQISDDKTFTTFTEIAHVTNGDGGEDSIPTNMLVKGRYVRMQGITRATGYGYSFFEFRIYGVTSLTPVQIQLDVPYVQYMKLNLSPVDLNNNGQLIFQNTNQLMNLSYNQGTLLSLSLLDFRGDYDVNFWTYKQGSTTDSIIGLPLNVTVYKDMILHVKLTPKPKKGNMPPVADAGLDQILYYPQSSTVLNGSNSSDPDGIITAYKWTQVSGPNTAVITNAFTPTATVSNLLMGDYRFNLTVTDDSLATGTDGIVVSVKPPDQIDFQLRTPADSAMVTTTRRPTLTWDAYPNASLYEIYVNITRSDYDWYASGNLLDRYTKVGESTTNSFSLTSDLVDRWTYKWYVVATTPDGTKYSNKLQFGLYIPAMSQEADGITIINGCRDMNKDGIIEPFEDWHLTPEQRVADLMTRLTTQEKMCQLFYGGDDNPMDGFAFSYGVESGMRVSQYAAAKTRMGIPVAFSGDKVHGWKTIYPTQLGLAATRDMNLVYQCGNMQRQEQKSFGFTGALCPLAEVDTKVLYPRIQEGNGENADDAAAIIRAILCGMQGGPEINPHSMMVTVKHWPSQGAGGENVLQYDSVTIKYHMKPWIAAVECNAQSVMPGYNTCPYLDPLNGANSSKKVIDYLRNELNFKGYVVTDWLAANTAQSSQSLGAGIDVMGGAPSDSTNVNLLVQNIGIDRINESCKRVLENKIRMGMFENPYSDPTCTWNTTTNHALVLNAAEKSITMLKNDGVLPFKLNSGDEVVVGGPRASWDISDNDPNTIWQSIYYSDAQAKTYVQAMLDRAALNGIKVYQDSSANTKVAVVVIGEKGYTHGTEWANTSPDIPADQLAIIQKFHDKGVKVITVILMPRPYVLTSLIDISDAILVVYRGGTGIGQATAACIFGDFAPSGKLPFQLPKSDAQIGTDNTNNMIEKWDLPYDIGATDAERISIRSYIQQGLTVPPIFGDPLFQYGFGIQGFGAADSTPSTAFDLTSPINNSAVAAGNILFTWQPSTDPETSIKYYEFYMDNVKKAEVTSTSYTYSITDSGAHTWYVNAVNGGGLSTVSTSTFHLTAASATAIPTLKISNRELNAYPNPFHDKLNISLSGSNGLNRIRIMDITGKTIIDRTIEGTTTEFDLSAYPSGLYNVVVDGNRGIKTCKLIKN
jgi:beta-glucosidase-like glycosyl hydrolase